MNKEVQPKKDKGVLERIGYLSRNAEIAVGTIALFFGHLGFAALMGIGATIDHAGIKYLEGKRTKKEKSKERVIFQANPQAA